MKHLKSSLAIAAFATLLILALGQPAPAAAACSLSLQRLVLRLRPLASPVGLHPGDRRLPGRAVRGARLRRR